MPSGSLGQCLEIWHRVNVAVAATIAGSRQPHDEVDVRLRMVAQADNITGSDLLTSLDLDIRAVAPSDDGSGLDIAHVASEREMNHAALCPIGLGHGDNAIDGCPASRPSRNGIVHARVPMRNAGGAAG